MGSGDNVEGVVVAGEMGAESWGVGREVVRKDLAFRIWGKKGDEVTAREITVSSTVVAGRGEERVGGGTSVVVDSGASHNILCSRRNFTKIVELDEWRRIVTVEKGGVRNASTFATHKGEFRFMTEGGGIISGEALYADIVENILSTNQMKKDKGVDVDIQMRVEQNWLVMGGDKFGLGKEVPMRIGGYFVSGESGEQKMASGTVGEVSVQMTEVEMAMHQHCKHGHVSMEKLRETIKGGGIKGAKLVGGVGRRLYCEICAAAKMKRQHTLKTKKREEELKFSPGCVISLDRLISPVQGIGGGNSAIVAMDLATRYAKVFIMKTKEMDEFLLEVVPEIILEARNQRKNAELTAKDITIVLKSESEEKSEVDSWMRVRSDGEFADIRVREMWARAGFKMQVTAPNDSDSNPFAERLIGTLKNMTRVNLLAANMAEEMWEDALMMSCYRYNIMSHSAFVRGEGKKKTSALYSPLMRRNGKVPEERDQHTSFCPVAVFTSPDKVKLGAWEPRAVEGIFCGWCENDPHVYHVRLTGGKSVAQLIEEKDKEFTKLVRMHHVIFDEYFNSCKNDSPMKRMFQNRKLVRGVLRVEVEGGKLFEYSGRGSETEREERVRRTARESKRVDYQEDGEEKGDERLPGGERDVSVVRKKHGEQTSSVAIGKKKDKKIERPKREVGKRGNVQKGTVESREVEKIKKKQEEKGKSEKEGRVKDRQRRNIGAMEGGVLGSLGGFVATYLTSVQEGEEGDEDSEEGGEEQEREEGDRESGSGEMDMGGSKGLFEQLPEVAKQSLGNEKKASHASDYEGWLRTMEQALQVDSVDWDMKSIVVEEKPYAKARHPQVRAADEKEIVFNRDSRRVFEPVTREQIPEWCDKDGYMVQMVRAVKEGQGLEGGMSVGEFMFKSRLVVMDLARRKPKTRVDPRGSHRDYVLVTAAFAGDIESKRLFYMLASILKIEVIWQGDFKCAFTNAQVPEWMHVYIRMHPAMREFFPAGTEILRLRRFLYGLRDAPRQWFVMLMETLEEFGFKDLGAAFDKGLLFMKTPTGGLAVLVVHTDDLLGFSTQIDFMEILEKYLRSKFEMTTNQFKGEHVYCGISVSRNIQGGWSIGQERYIDRCMQSLGITEKARKGGRQLPYGEMLTHEEQGEGETSEELVAEEFGFKYDRAAGMLVHLLQTRLDCDMSIRQLARFSKSPGRRHYEFMKHFLLYVKGNKGAKIGYNWGKGQNTSAKINVMVATDPKWDPKKDGVAITGEGKMVEVFADSEFGGDKIAWRQVYSHTGYVNGGPIYTQSVVASSIQKSTMAAEALACSDAQDKVIYLVEWLKRVDKINGGKFELDPGIPVILGDNGSVISAVNHDDGVNTIHAPQHVRLKLEAVRQAIIDGELVLAKVGTKNNPADLGTKTLPANTNARASSLILNDLEGYFTEAM